jgi:glycosyltransferase involved in cell wall biosynthesis
MDTGDAHRIRESKTGMKTLVLTPEVFATEGGISRILRLYIRALVEDASEEAKLEIVALKDSPADTQRLSEVTGSRSARIRGYQNQKLVFSIAALLAGASSDRILCGHLHQLVIAWAAQRLRPSLSYYLVAHGIEVWRPYSCAERIALRGAEKILCVSEYTRRQMLRFDPALEPRRLVLLPNTFDPRFQAEPVPSQTPFAAPRKPRILVVSRLSAGDPYKGVDTLIEAMPRVLLKYPEAQLRIVGDGSDRKRLEAIAKARNLEGTTQFCGILNDESLAKEYQECDLFALPSRKEGFGLVYLEAMSYGKPCIAARSGGAPEVVNNTVGVLVEYGNIEQIVVAISELIRRKRNEEKILARAREFNFSGFKIRLIRSLTPKTKSAAGNKSQ